MRIIALIILTFGLASTAHAAEWTAKKKHSGLKFLGVMLYEAPDFSLEIHRDDKGYPLAVIKSFSDRPIGSVTLERQSMTISADESDDGEQQVIELEPVEFNKCQVMSSKRFFCIERNSGKIQEVVDYFLISESARLTLYPKGSFTDYGGWTIQLDRFKNIWLEAGDYAGVGE